MLTLTMKKKWFDMILSGEKKEEYREIKQYYISRFTKALGFPKSKSEDVNELLSQMEALKSFEILFKNGYAAKSPSIVASCYVSIGQGKPEWGAEPGKEYYILKIDEIVLKNV